MFYTDVKQQSVLDLIKRFEVLKEINMGRYAV
jgi:hypothetical protein